MPEVKISQGLCLTSFLFLAAEFCSSILSLCKEELRRGEIMPNCTLVPEMAQTHVVLFLK